MPSETSAPREAGTSDEIRAKASAACTLSFIIHPSAFAAQRLAVGSIVWLDQSNAAATLTLRAPTFAVSVVVVLRRDASSFSLKFFCSEMAMAVVCCSRWSRC